MTNTFTLVTSHFGDIFWIRHSLERVNRLSDARLERVVVIDQSRARAGDLAELPRVTDVLSFTPDEQQILALGHDHPTSLNRAMASLNFHTSHVIVLDSDCFPIEPTWLDNVGPSTVAADPSKWGLSHPCLLIFPSKHAKQLNFAEGVDEVGLDTGRLIGLQLHRLGETLHFSGAQPAFRGLRGHFYLDRTVYHHGSGSFSHSDDVRLLRQVQGRRDRFFQAKVAKDEYTLSLADRLRLAPATTLRTLRKNL